MKKHYLKFYQYLALALMAVVLLSLNSCGKKQASEPTQKPAEPVKIEEKEKFVNGWNISEDNYIKNGNFERALALLDKEIIIYTALKESILEEVLDYPQSYYGEIIGFQAVVDKIEDYPDKAGEKLKAYEVKYGDRLIKIISTNTLLEKEDNVSITGWLLGKEGEQLVILAGYCQKTREELILENVDEQDYMKYAGQTEAEVKTALGEPESKTDYEEGKWWNYGKRSLIFSLDEEPVVSGIYLGKGEKIVGVTIGLTLEDVQKVLGSGDVVKNEKTGLYTLNYRINRNLIVFTSETEKGETQSCEVYFKDYEKLKNQARKENE